MKLHIRCQPSYRGCAPVTTYLEWRIIAFDPKAISNTDLYEWRAPRDQRCYTICPHLQVHIHTIVSTRGRKEPQDGALRVSFDIYNLFREKSHAEVARESTYEDCNQRLSPAFQREEELEEESSRIWGTTTGVTSTAFLSANNTRYCNRGHRHTVDTRRIIDILDFFVDYYFWSICISSWVFGRLGVVWFDLRLSMLLISRKKEIEFG